MNRSGLDAKPPTRPGRRPGVGRRRRRRRALSITILAIALFATACGQSSSAPDDVADRSDEVEGAVATPEPTESDVVAEPPSATPEIAPTPIPPTVAPTSTALALEPASAPPPTEPAATPTAVLATAPTAIPPAAAVPAAPAASAPTAIPPAAAVPARPAPTATPYPAIAVGCSIAPQRAVVVRETLTFTATQYPTTPKVDFAFDHGDGTIDRRAVSVAYYNAPGDYAVRLNWTYAGRSGSVFCGVVKVLATTPPPTPNPLSVSCSISPRRPVVVGEIVTLTASHAPGNLVVSYAFEHGDGTIDRTSLSKAYYAAPGDYTVKLNWAHAGRNGTIVCGVVKVVRVPSTPTPVVSITCRIEPKLRVIEGQTLTYTAVQSPANAVVSYAFDHGDGTIDRRQVSKAYYAAPGVYNVTLYWSHAGGSGSRFCGTVTVDPAPRTMFNPADYLGKPLATAESIAAGKGFVTRIVRNGDQYFPATDDYRPDRINFEVDLGVVTEATNG